MHPPMHWHMQRASLPVNPNTISTPPNLYGTELHYTAATDTSIPKNYANFVSSKNFQAFTPKAIKLKFKHCIFIYFYFFIFLMLVLLRRTFFLNTF